MRSAGWHGPDEPTGRRRAGRIRRAGRVWRAAAGRAAPSLCGPASKADSELVAGAAAAAWCQGVAVASLCTGRGPGRALSVLLVTVQPIGGLDENNSDGRRGRPRPGPAKSDSAQVTY